MHAVNLGSGEGVCHQYREWRKAARGEDGGTLEWVRRSVLFQVAEAELHKALGECSGSTLDGLLRCAWIGEPLGFAYADRAKRIDVPALSYRLCLVAQITPSLGSVLLNGRNEGTPQRFIYLPVTDPADPDEVPAKPQPLTWNPAVPYYPELGFDGSPS